MTEMGVTGGYVRHRDRMIQESVFEDLTNVLIACRWMAGTTSREVRNPYGGAWEIVTTSAAQVLPLVEGNPVVLIDYFPETEAAITGDPDASKTAPNTLAMDSGTRGDAVPRELGSTAEFVPYTFSMAFYAISDAVALAVLNDLNDRYRGRLVREPCIDLWDYNSGGSEPVVRMDVDYFRYALNTNQDVAPHQVHLYFAELGLTDEVD